MAINSIRGFNDVLPEESLKWHVVEKEAKRILDTYGFSEMRTPLVERTELFARSIGESTDIVEKEMYTFFDRKGESITLRPEGTAPVVRAYIEHKLHQKSPAAKFYYMGPMFRYERPQKGRARQFYQIGAEAFGIAEPSIDAEVIDMLVSLFGRLSLTDLELQINSLGCETCRPRYRDRLTSYLVEKVPLLCTDCQRRAATNPLRVLDCKKDDCKNATSDAPVMEDFLCNLCREHFEGVKDSLNILDVSFNLNPRMVRGLDYYTRTAFEIVSKRLGAQNAVVAGGRYDRLVKELGGADTPAFGFALGMERLVSLLNPGDLHMSIKPLLYFIPLGITAQRKALRFVKGLREEGLKVEMGSGDRSLKGHMKRADKLGARQVLILGDDELDKGEITLKDMESGSQRRISLDNTMVELKESFKKTLRDNERICS